MQLFGLVECTLLTRPQTTFLCSQPDLVFLIRRGLGVFLLLVLTSLAVSAQTQAGIHIDLPANGQLRIENRFGDITTSVGIERDVLISFEVIGNNADSGSPVVVETSQNLLSVSVKNSEIDWQRRVNLTVRLPANTKAEIVTREGTILSRGLPASLSLNTVGGNILVEIEEPLDVDVAARSLIRHAACESDA